VGPNAFRDNTGNPTGFAGSGRNMRGAVLGGLLPSYIDTNNRNVLNGRVLTEYATGWWGGLTGEITAADPFRFAWDAVYGSVTHPDASYMNRQGWYINLLAEYKLDWGVPGLYFLWGSGDSDSPSDGSGRMPVASNATPDNQLSTFWLNGSPTIGSWDGASGSAYVGTWGIGARIRDMSFLEDLKHTLRVNFIGGTNSPRMAKYLTGKPTNRRAVNGVVVGGANTLDARGEFNNANGGGPYLTTQDYAVEVTLDSVYKIYDNLEMMLELGYMHVWLDQSKGMWGAAEAGRYGNAAAIRGVSTTDALKASLWFKYSF
jgi:hypothetical protein